MNHYFVYFLHSNGRYLTIRLFLTNSSTRPFPMGIEEYLQRLKPTASIMHHKNKSEDAASVATTSFFPRRNGFDNFPTDVNDGMLHPLLFLATSASISPYISRCIDEVPEALR